MTGRRRLGGLTLLWIGIALLGCESRERLNPFDPRNPETGGTPGLLDARAGDGEVRLAWDLDRYDGIDRLLLYRQRPGGADPVLLTPGGIDREMRDHVDRSVSNGETYEFALAVRLESGFEQRTRWDAATPGRAIPWVADSEGGGLSRLTPDGRDRISSLGGGSWFLDIDGDPAAGIFWAADYLGGRLIKITLDGEVQVRVEVQTARAVAVAPGSGSVWVGTFGTGRLERYLADGSFAWADTSVGHVEDLHLLENGDLWLVNAEGELRFYRDDRLLNRIGDFDRPVAIAPSSEGSLLVLERGAKRVRRYEASGFPQGRSDPILADPLDLCSDGQGGAWVADPGRGGLVRIDGRMQETGFVSLPGIYGVTYDPIDSLLWACGEGGVHVRERDGAARSRLAIGPRPVEVAVFHPQARR